MTHTLEYLITNANTTFPNGFILQEYQRGSSGLRPAELLAQFLVAEIRELYDAKSSNGENLSRIITNLEMASSQLTAVTQGFQDLRDVSLS